MIDMGRKHNHSGDFLKNIVYAREWVNVVHNEIGKSTFRHNELPKYVQSLSFLKRAKADGFIRKEKRDHYNVTTWRIVRL